MAFDGIIFDFNGVLWWDTHLQQQAWAQFASEVRGAPFSLEELAVQVHGRNNRHTLEYLYGRKLSADEIGQLTQKKETLYRRLCLDQGTEFRLSPGAINLLDFLVAHSVPHTIATASEKYNVDFFIHQLGLANWFDISALVFDDGRLPGKPAPDIYLLAAKRLRLAPARCIVVEDSRSGILAAHAAGIGLVVALGPDATHAELAKLPGVGLVVASLADLPKGLLKGQ